MLISARLWFFFGFCSSLVLAAGRNVIVSATTVAPGGSMAVYWTVPENASKNAWLGFYVIGTNASDKEALLWSQKSDGQTSGKATVTVPTEPGQYEFRLFPEADFSNPLSSEMVRVETLLAQPSAVKAGAKFNVKFTAPTNVSKSDWIGLFKISKNKKGGVPWKQKTKGVEAGLISLTAPTEAGIYEFRYFGKNGKEVSELRSPTLSVVDCLANSKPRTKIEHLVVIVSENHSFDSYFGRYCKATTASDPKCTAGTECCESGPGTTPGSDVEPTILTDAANTAHDPNHQFECNVEEVNGGKMDRFISGTTQPHCADPRNFAYADEKTAGAYWDLARKYAMGDRVFQSVQGASSSNNMYLARGKFVFVNNIFQANAVGGACAGGPRREYYDTTVGDLLNACEVPWTYFAEGYRQAADAHPKCVGKWPKAYDPGDVQTAYYPSTADKTAHMKDYLDFKEAVKKGTLPAVTFLKAYGWRSEHPKDSNISDGIGFTKEVMDAVYGSSVYGKKSLVILTPDEGGGYFDHVPPPADSVVDNKPYGVRIFMLATGPFAKTNHISHVQMEHSSLLKFIEWNWLGGQPGQLGTRDATSNGIGSLLDPKKTGVPVPE